MQPIGSALASVAEHEPDILFNRTIGLGVGTPIDRGDLEAIVQRYDSAAVRCFFLHLHPDAQPTELTGWLTELGLIPARAWMKFRRDAHPAEVRPSSFDIRRVDAQHAEGFARIVASCFGLTPASRQTLTTMTECPHWHLFMSFANGVPAGTGAVYISAGSRTMDRRT